MVNIHQTAIVNPRAKLGVNVTIGPYAIIHEDVEIGDGTYVGPHTVIYDGARIGSNVKFFQSVSVAHRPQDLKYADEKTYFYVGDNCTIHEFVTLHRGTKETGKSEIGKNVLLMAYSHVAHDCYIGNNCILANSVQVAGHVHIDDYAIIGGTTPVHQFCKVGKHCMVGGGFRVVQDVPPFILAAKEPLAYEGLNVIGLRRRGFSNQQIETLKKAYSYIYGGHYNVSQAKEQLIAEFPGDPYVAEIIEFLGKSKRGLIGK